MRGPLLSGTSGGEGWEGEDGPLAVGIGHGGSGGATEWDRSAGTIGKRPVRAEDSEFNAVRASPWGETL